MNFKVQTFNKKRILSFILIISFITNISSGIIEPDDILPLEIFPPFGQSPDQKGTKFVFRFYIPNYRDKDSMPTTRGYGAANGQYIGIRFTPENDFFVYNVNNINIYHECNIIQVETNRNIPLKALKDGNNANNKNVIYCKIESYNNENILSPGYNYKLTLTLKNNLNSDFSKLISISLFTSTLANSDLNDIIDIGTFNHINIHPIHDPLNQDNTVAELSGINLIDGEVESNINFDVSINFKEWFAWDDYIICLNIPKNQVSAENPMMEIEKPIGSNIDIPLGDMNIINLESDNERQYIGFFLDNSGKENSAGDTLLLKFSGLKTKDAGLISESTTNNGYIGIEIRYRNSQVICSSLKITLTVTLKNMKFTVKHPESNEDDNYKFDVYRGGAFQIEFNINSQKNVYNKYIVIKQKESKMNQRVTFIASSCDFSDFNITSNNFNEIPKCYPIKIKNRETNDDNSNGIFFYYPYILNANINYKLKVWMFFDECGVENGDDKKVEIKFSLEMYNDIHKNKIAENRFDSNFIFLQEKETQNGIWCYNTHMGDKKYNNGYLFNMNHYSVDNKLLYREYFNWNVYKHDSETDDENQILNKILLGEEVTPKFIYANDAENKLKDGTHLLLVSKITLDSGNNEKLGQFFPMGLTKNPDGTKNAIKGKFFIKLSKDFFKKAEDTSKCYVSWAFGSPSISSDLKLKPEPKSYPNQKYNFIVSSKDFFSDDKTALFKPVIDTSKIKDNYLESEVNEGWDSDRALWSFGDDENLEDQISDEAPVDVYFALIDTCHVWKNLNQNIKSLYTPIEIVIGITGTSTDYSRVMRFIKLYPETGVWHDNTLTGNNRYITSSNFIIKNHFAYNKKEVDDDINDKGVCLLEITKGILDTRRERSTNFFLWIFMGSLLETEYTQTQATYPIGNLPDTAQAYGYSSQHSLNPNNFYAKPSSTQNSDITSPIYNIANSMTSLYQTGTTGYLFYLGSLIVINNRVSRNSLYDSPNDSLLIPYYCPYYISQGETKPFTFGIFPSFIAGFGSFSSMTNLGNGGLDRIIGKQINDNQINILMLSDIKIYQEKFKDIDGLRHYYNTVKFINDYKNNIRTLNVWNSDKATPCDNEYDSIDSFIFFFNEKITQLNNINPRSNIPSRLKTITKSKKGNYCFYVFGKKFCSGIYGVTNDDLLLTRNVPSTGDQNPYLSININFEITADLLVCESESDKFCPIDFVAFWGISSNHDMPSYVTNYYIDSFLLDYHIYTEYINSDNKPDMELGQSLAFKNDPAIYVKIIFSTPFTTAILNNTILYFTIKDMPNAHCSVQSSNVSLPSVNCDTIAGEISCKLVFSSMKYNIFCYDLDYGSSGRFYFNNFKLSLPNLDTYPDLDSIIFHDTNEYVFNTQNSNKEPVIPSIQRNFITSPYNKDSYTKMELVIDIKRPAHPGMKIEIIFDEQIYFDEKSYCKLSLDKLRAYSMNDIDIDQFWTKGNANIENCRIIKDSSSGNDIYKIIAKLDNKIYKIENLPNFIYIYIWPFKKGDENYIKLSVTVNDKYILSNTDGSGINRYFSNTNEFLDLFSCSISGNIINMDIKPSSNIVGDLSDYTFTITGSLGLSTISLVQIFFPKDINFECEECVKCYSLSNSGSINKISCNFADENILNVFISFSNVNSFIVTGIINPKITNPNSNIYYNLAQIDSQGNRHTCHSNSYSLNSITFINDPNIERLKFFYVKNAVSDNNPRSKATYTFRFSFDYANKDYSSGYPILNKDSLVYIYFPKDYHLYINQNPTGTKFICYYSDGSNIPINVDTKILGRKIRIILNDATYSNKKLKYIEIVINNIKNPNRITNKNKYTGYFKIVCLNPPSSSSEYYYTTGINSNTFRTNFITEENERSGEYNWYRGFMIKTNSTYEDKLILDVLYENKVYDFIFLQPGRYTKVHFVTSSDNEKKSNFYLKPSYTKISFSSSETVKALEDEYIIPSLLIEPYEFYLGVPCTTSDGIYVVSPKILINSNAYLSPPDIIVNVRQIETAKVEFIQDDIGYAPLNGKSRIYYYLSEINFDSLNIDWTRTFTPLKKNVNILHINIPEKTITDKNKKLSEVFSTATIQLKSGETEINRGSYNFIGSNINRCYELNPKELTINELSSISFLDFSSESDYKLSNRLTIRTKENDDSLLSNDIKFYFYPPLEPSFIMCELYCPYLTPDDSSNLQFYDFDSMNNHLKTIGQNYFRKYSSNYFYASQESGTLIFPNVIKGYNYNAKCVYQTTQSDNTKVKSQSYSLISENLHSDFPAKTVCNTFYIMNAIKKEIQEKYINYCQYTVGNVLGINGCAICTDCSGKIIPPGFSLYFPFNCLKEQCYDYSNNNLLNEMYDLAEEFNTNSKTEKYEFTICLTSNRICSTQITDDDLRFALNQFVNEVKDKEKANELFEIDYSDINYIVYSSYYQNKIYSEYQININDVEIEFIEELNSYGNAVIKASYNMDVSYNILCFWRIKLSEEEAPNIEEMINCKLDETLCGVFVANYGGHQYKIPDTRRKNLGEGVYSMYIACSHFVPSPVYFSEIKNVLTKEIQSVSFSEYFFYINYIYLLIFIFLLY